MNTDEILLDRLEELRMKRIAEIREKGSPFTLANSEARYQGVLSTDRKSIRFEGRTPLLTGQVYELKGFRFFVLAITPKAGEKVADIAEIVSTATVYRRAETKTGAPGAAAMTNLVPDSLELPIFRYTGAEITVPKYAAGYMGKVLAITGALYEIVSARIEGPTAVLQLREYRPETPKLPDMTVHPFIGGLATGAPNAAPVRGWSPWS